MSATKAQPSTIQVSPEEMETRIARFSDLRPQSEFYDKSRGIPADAYLEVTARKLFTVMAPSSQAGPMSATPGVTSDEKLSVIVAECPPGDRPMLHAHFHTTEHFMCLKGRFRIRWGDEGEHETVLEPFDFIAVPKAVCRDFTNITDETAHLLVLITGEKDEDYNDIAFAPSESATFKKKFGNEVAGQLESIGFSFLEKEETS